MALSPSWKVLQFVLLVEIFIFKCAILNLLAVSSGELPYIVKVQLTALG